VGVLLFTPLLALLPTTAVWYIFATLLHGGLVAAGAALQVAAWLAGHDRLYLLLRRLRSPGLFPGEYLGHSGCCWCSSSYQAVQFLWGTARWLSRHRQLPMVATQTQSRQVSCCVHCNVRAAHAVHLLNWCPVPMVAGCRLQVVCWWRCCSKVPQGTRPWQHAGSSETRSHRRHQPQPQQQQRQQGGL
jgi:hypothetical protein